MRAFTVSLAVLALAGVNVVAAPTPVVAAPGHLAGKLNIRRDHTFKVIRRAAEDCDESGSSSATAPAVTGYNSTLPAYNATLPCNATLSYNGTISNCSSNSTSFSEKHTGYWSSQGASSASTEEDDEDCDDGEEEEETCPDGYEPVYEDDETTTSSTYSATATSSSASASATSALGGEVVAAAYKGHHQSSSASSSTADETATSTSSSAAAASSTGSSGGSSGGVSGIATYFTQNGNPGACGNYNSDSTFLIAVRPEWYKNGENCGKTVTITAANGHTQTAKIQDECPSCDTVDSIDMSTGLWDSFGYSTDAGVFDVTWTCDGCSAP